VDKLKADKEQEIA
jgi:chromosome segregation ATPase